MKIKQTYPRKTLAAFSLKSLLLIPLFTGCINQSNLKLNTPLKESNQTTIPESNQTTIPESNQTTHLRYNIDELKTPLLIEHETIASIMDTSNLEVLLTSVLEVQESAVEENWLKESSSEEILETAKAFLGVKYVWAANGPSAFDCSGFTQYVFKENGIDLPRYSGHQANIGEKIAFKDLQRGDLVFFDTEKKFRHRVNHVGIYMGENKFIHASSAKKKVIITSFSKKKYYKNKFLYARRITRNQSFALHITPNNQKSLIN